MKGYTSKTALENYTLQTIDASFDDQVTAWIESIEKYIDNYTERNFVADIVAVDRLYDGDGSGTLLIDDAIQITGIEIDGVALEVADYYLYPSNQTPKRKIVLSEGLFTRGNQNITVTGKFGYSAAVPSDIKLAATILVAGIIKYSNNSVKSEKIGEYSVSYDTDSGWQSFENALRILDSYKQYNF